MTSRAGDRLRALVGWVSSLPMRSPDRPAVAPGPLREQVLGTEATLRRVLAENIIPFWESRALDREHGGYLLNHDQSGRWLGPGPKYLVVQARTLWFFSRLARTGHGSAWLEQARSGFDFLRLRMWDDRSGGFRWAVDPSGHQCVDGARRVYGQAFALFAIAEYALASGGPEARELAATTFGLLEEQYRDPEHGGYLTSLDPSPGSVHAHSGLKSQNDHLHLLEALSLYAELDPGPRVRERLWELLEILTSTVTRADPLRSIEAFGRDWTAVLPPDRAPVSFGHDIEAAWLTLHAADRLGLAPSVLREYGLGILETLVRCGLDRRGGGVWCTGPVGRRADDRRKVWWVQAEALVGCLELYCRFGSESAAQAYLSVLDWVVTRQVDWPHGEWHDTILPDGRVTGGKAHPWKGPYHTGRAMLECLERLRSLAGAVRPSAEPAGGPASS